MSFTGFGPVKGLGFRLCPLQVLGLEFRFEGLGAEDQRDGEWPGL